MTNVKCAYEYQIKSDGKCPVKNDLCEYYYRGKCQKIQKEER